MIKQGVISRISFLAAGLVIFLVGFFLLLNLVIPAFLVLVLAYLALKNHETKSYTFLHLAFLFLMNFSIGYFIMMHDLPIYYIPFAVIPMLACILFNDLEIALLLSLTSSISIVSVKSDHLALSVFLFTSGLFASLLVYGARRRITLIRAGFSIGAMQMLLFFFLNSFRIGHLEPFLWFAVNGVVSSIIVVGALRIFEYLFDTMTNFTLLELADFNHPLLQRMTLEAPGTYHHSLVVGNLADAASRVVGANALLARIGAYYHDIGKLQKPHYFSENQSLSESRHDSLSATMSKLVIMNHVKEGVELAQKYKLHKNIIDFINQHHGTSLVYYFYRRALENLEGTGQQVEEEGFRYPNKCRIPWTTYRNVS
ncbi:MAG: HDIG domain-containing protein [Candidatus Omnitrophica bacterium]|nr:HDIG domain-containing protein [Candidatus Omnitrophota bacterium]